MTALYFGVLAAYGYFTKRDLTGLRSFLFAGLLFLALYWVVSNIYALVENIAFDRYFKAQDRKAAKAEEVGI